MKKIRRRIENLGNFGVLVVRIQAPFPRLHKKCTIWDTPGFGDLSRAGMELVNTKYREVTNNASAIVLLSSRLASENLSTFVKHVSLNFEQPPKIYNCIDAELENHTRKRLVAILQKELRKCFYQPTRSYTLIKCRISTA
eukprot:m.245658 g.245658  ORF g.245658 m.245658 type:complete len:140 (-) comp26637_c1_seq8:1137-1556(-)